MSFEKSFLPNSGVPSPFLVFVALSDVCIGQKSAKRKQDGQYETGRVSQFSYF
jgi:hypothetical protein